MLITLGRAFMALGENRKAGEGLMEALDIAGKYKFAFEISRANRYLSDLWAAKGDYERALAFYKTSKEYEEQISNNLNLRYVNDMIQRYESEKRAQQITLLAQENETVRQKLRNNRNLLIAGGIGLILLAGILYILYRQYHLSNEKRY